MTSKTFDVPQIHCDGCVQTVTSAVRKLPGIAKVEASAVTKRVLVEFDPQAVDEARIREALKTAGYPAA
ncbi:MAG: heavy-metal-associated domain-containing protein [Armatimonadota bacterium]|nr:heavy-metal-associated domain-containing protein [Armatimonadota bacterium]MDR7487014.1 heavy-metal-associated domain-containing protein [Armatimonadota bacterium]MDR7533408.1 heavy-metal-associated domain-containing protein [Armatimonadota bacterium]MDR7535224.1 heavy-metal-associated domain-containing protein [Armatimonadota bacterium]